jgi:hypothetical protein
MASDERSDLLQQYLIALASYFEASAEHGDPRSIEEFRNQAERAFTSLEEPE